MTHFIPTEDVIESYKDGSGSVVVARAGQPIAWAMALELGLVSGEPPLGFQIVTEPGGAPLQIVSAGSPAILDEEVRDAAGEVVARAKASGKKGGD